MIATPKAVDELIAAGNELAKILNEVAEEFRPAADDIEEMNDQGWMGVDVVLNRWSRARRAAQ